MTQSSGLSLQRAFEWLKAGDLERAARACDELLKHSPGHPAVLHLKGVTAWQRGDVATAEQAFRDSVTRSPKQPGVLLDLGKLLRSQGRDRDAEAPLRDALAMDPNLHGARHQLGLLLFAAGRLDEARGFTRELVEQVPANSSGWELLAAIEQQRGDLSAAIAACRGGIAQSPQAARLHYSLGQILRQDANFADAVSAYEAARRLGFRAPDVFQNLGEAQFEAGYVDQAFATFTAGVAAYPDHPGLHRLRARFHWESGAPGDPVEALRAAAHRYPDRPALWQVLVDLLNRLERADEGRAELEEARRRGCPWTPELELLQSMAFAKAGDARTATQRFDVLVEAHPDRVGFKLTFAEHLLTAGDPARAEQLCAAVLDGNRFDQLAWALRGTAWQLLGDAREAWLLDYERMVVPVRVPPPSGMSTAAFFGELEAALSQVHRMQAHPIEQTVRGGTQTNGYLFRLKHPLLRVLENQMRIAVARAIATFPDVADHPFWSRRPRADDAFRFAGAWSVRLRSQGYHTNHIHPEGWVSSALYVALPREVRTATDNAGCLQFGVPRAELGLAIAPRRIVKPEVGELVLFPSYMWHGTVPFTSQEPRITVAFDVVPTNW